MDWYLLAQIVGAAVLAALTAAIGWLVRTVGANQRNSDVLAHAVKKMADEIGTIKSDGKTLDERLDAHAERIATTEAINGEVRRLHEDLRLVHQRIDRVLGETSELKGALNALDRTNAAILEALIGHKA